MKAKDMQPGKSYTFAPCGPGENTFVKVERIAVDQDGVIVTGWWGVENTSMLEGAGGFDSNDEVEEQHDGQ